MPDSLHYLTISAPIERVFDLLTTGDGLRRWWTASTRAAPDVGHVNTFGFGNDTVQMHFRVDRSDAPNSLRWTCVDNPATPRDWVGTQIIAQLVADGESTRLDFAHRGWAEEAASYSLCNTTWGALMYRLRDVAEGREFGPLFGPSASEIVQRYHEAWTSGHFEQAEQLLAPDLDFRGPMDRFTNRAPFLDALRRLGPITRSAKIVGVLDRGSDVCLQYELETVVPSIGTTSVAEWFTVRGGEIARIRLWFDPRPYVEMFEARG